MEQHIQGEPMEHIFIQELSTPLSLPTLISKITLNELFDTSGSETTARSAGEMDW